MKFAATALSLRALKTSFSQRSLIANPEYQRGKAWDLVQQQVFIDSLFRGYPVPTIFLYKVETPDLEGGIQKKYEIVDGQQRIRAICDFLDGKFSLLSVTDKKFRIPDSLREPNEWSGKSFGELGELQTQFEELQVNVQMISDVRNPDEIRDLFIRLQSGTALTRQQVRDAWPGSIGPFIESVAGKMDRRPKVKLFSLIDGRGERASDDDGDDEYSNDRTTAAQLLALFLAREKSERNFVGIGAKEIDALYHEQSCFDPNGDAARSYIDVLKFTESLLGFSTSFSENSNSSRRKSKYSKHTIVAIFCWCHDFEVAKKQNRAKIGEAGMQTIADYIQTFKPPGTKGQSALKLRAVFEAFKEGFPAEATIDVDPCRVFSQKDKQAIREKQGGKCSRHHEFIAEEDAEYHHIVAWARGGRTTQENGEMMCKKCHSIHHGSETGRVSTRL
jgi:hypothetical protein